MKFFYNEHLFEMHLNQDNWLYIVLTSYTWKIYDYDGTGNMLLP